MRPVVTLDDSAILSLLNDADIAAKIPCLTNKRDVFNAKSGTCGMCAQKRQERQRKEMATIKTCIAGMSAEKKAELKRALNAEKVRIVYTSISQQVTQLTF
jgi:DNA-binding transcriptional regulator GbsR (MarR family)